MANDEREGSPLLSRTSEGVQEIKVDRSKATQTMQTVGIARLSMNGSGVNFVFDNGDRFTLSVVVLKRLLAGQIEFAGVSFCDKWGKSGVPKEALTTQ